jgi:hypothetical protein
LFFLWSIIKVGIRTEDRAPGHDVDIDSKHL